MKTWQIYLDGPAPEWENATPVGCGRMGTMIYGLPGRERIQLSEERIWSGDAQASAAPALFDKLERLRALQLLLREQRLLVHQEQEERDRHHSYLLLQCLKERELRHLLHRRERELRLQFQLGNRKTLCLFRKRT